MDRTSHAFVTAAAIEQWYQLVRKSRGQVETYPVVPAGVIMGERLGHYVVIHHLSSQPWTGSFSFLEGWRAGYREAQHVPGLSNPLGLWFFTPPVIGAHWLPTQSALQVYRESTVSRPGSPPQEGLVLCSAFGPRSHLLMRVFVAAAGPDEFRARELVVQLDPDDPTT